MVRYSGEDILRINTRTDKSNLFIFFFSFTVNFDHFQILRAIGKGSFGKVRMVDF